MDDIEKIRQSKIIQEPVQQILLVVFIAIPLELYINVISNLKVSFDDTIVIYKLFIPFIIFAILSWILMEILNILLSIFFLNPTANTSVNRVIGQIHVSIILSAIFTFIVIVCVPFTVKLDTHVSFVSMILGILYSSLVVGVIYITFNAMREAIEKEKEEVDKKSSVLEVNLGS